MILRTFLSCAQKIVEGAEKQLLTAEFVVAFRFNGVDYEFKAPVVKTLSVPDKIALAPCWAGGDQLGVGIMAFAAQLVSNLLRITAESLATLMALA